MRCGALAYFGESVRGHEARLPAFAHNNPVRGRRPDCAHIRIWAQNCAAILDMGAELRQILG